MKRLKLQMISNQPGIDLNAIMSDGRKQRFMDQEEENNKLAGEMVTKSELVNMGKKFVEVQISNVELEQDMAILRKKFRDLLTTKGQPVSLADSDGTRHREAIPKNSVENHDVGKQLQSEAQSTELLE